ncbi:MAG: formylglycine-generating enzyme family protein [Lachnospiraceae bacterium]|nr:formylglycine-generating enzyme family protein [Lachnospiraceae bacterium]
MKTKLIALLAFLTAIIILSACVQESKQVDSGDVPEGFVLVKGGYFTNVNSNLYGKDEKVEDFYIGTHLVTQREWAEVMGSNPSEFIGDDNRPVEMINWYDAIEFLNRKSELENLEPFYAIDKENADPNNFGQEDDIRWTVTINPGANGYRLPTEIEWEYAASGGQLSENYLFSGSDDPDEVAWHFRNSGDAYLTEFWYYSIILANNCRTRPVGQKLPNELGLYDMSGNVREWCWDWHGEGVSPAGGEGRVIRGGGWLGQEDVCAVNYRNFLEGHYRFNDMGLRLVRNR